MQKGMPVGKDSSPRKRKQWMTLFFSPDEHRLRSGWRLVIQTICLLLLGLCVSSVILIPFTFLGGRQLTATSALVVNEVVKLFAFTPSVLLARRFLDRRSFSSLGLQLDRQVGLDLLAGLLISFVMMAFIYLAFLSRGWLHFQGFAWQTQPPAAVLGQTLLILLIFVMTGWDEELLSRGYHLQTFASGTNLAWGVIFSSSIFAILHLTNPDSSWISAAGLFFAGLFLALGYLFTGRLWLSIGLHIGWNFFEGPVFGFMVSGVDFYRLTHIAVSGPSAWTGGAFGPEAGLIILPAIALGSLLVWLYSKLRQRVSSPI